MHSCQSERMRLWIIIHVAFRNINHAACWNSFPFQASLWEQWPQYAWSIWTSPWAWLSFWVTFPSEGQGNSSFVVLLSGECTPAGGNLDTVLRWQGAILFCFPKVISRRLRTLSIFEHIQSTCVFFILFYTDSSRGLFGDFTPRGVTALWCSAIGFKGPTDIAKFDASPYVRWIMCVVKKLWKNKAKQNSKWNGSWYSLSLNPNLASCLLL